ncbi:uncharacterized protein LOC106152040 isoform X1 [Lingula anatina]|uniref:Uncharacterized protein LOC106152040 isoform X1 n=1 Tax=Lingula anatina TaxID=7574 RepID=A0A1S3H4S1_LINAN|nr:uncharacterized protein LOC106152040 isoform X1 [Lingula anatina]|eukprot:XP_013380967.1 uncharacterized protein LOC106152040 isoform X1 [Lingula anatina]
MATPVIDVYIKLPSGKTTTVNLLPSAQVVKIYEHVAKEAGVGVGQVQLKYTGKILKKQNTLGYLGVCKETILKAEVIPLKKINIYVKKTGGETLPLTIDNTSTVQEIKNQLEVKTDSEPAKQILKLSGALLKDNKETAIEAGIHDEALLTLEVKTAPAEVVETTTTVDDTASATQIDEEISEEDREAVLSTFDAAGRAVEVVFSFDTTGSMYSVLTQVRTKLKDTVTRLLRDIPNIRIGIIAHGDYCDYNKYVLRSADLTSSVDTLVDFVETVPVTSGGDTPECYEWVLRKAQQLDWAEDSAKALVVIGDCEPHPPSYTDQNINWHDELDVLSGMGVKVYGVQAMNNTDVKDFYQELAEKSGGAYITFQQFGLITDMFLAVCYTQAGSEQLQAFSEEMEMTGRMTEEAKAMFSQLEEVKVKEDTETDVEEHRETPQRYKKCDWWDVTLDHGSPQYTYDAQHDTWSPFTGEKSSSSSSSSSSSHHNPMMVMSLKREEEDGSVISTESKPKRWSLRKSFRKWFRK